MVSLDQYIKDGRKFDYIFADLTDVPISETASGELWDFINKVLTMSFKILKPTGKFMTHVGSTSSCLLFSSISCHALYCIALLLDYRVGVGDGIENVRDAIVKA